LGRDRSRKISEHPYIRGRRSRVATVEEHETETLSPKARKAIWGAFVGFFVDMFDIYLPIAVLGPATIYFVSPDLSTSAAAIVGGFIFASTLAGRPLGALLFGHYADRIGRRRITIIVVCGVGTATLLLALMPGYQQWGMVAVAIFILLRFVGGLFMGGEYTAANPLAMEYCPKQKRGFYSGIIQSGYPIAFTATALLTLLMLSVAPAGDLNSPYVQWGWRIPFVIGAVLAFALAAYYYFFVDESELFERSGGTESPLKTLFSGDNLKSFLQVFVMMSGFWLALNPVAAILPGQLGSQLGVSSTNVAVTLIIAYFVLAFAFVGAGALSQLIGRRLLFMLVGSVIVVVATFLYYLLISIAPESLLAVVLLSTAIIVLVQGQWGALTAYINERFHTGVRASGFGLGYSVAAILPAFYGFYQAGLGTFMPFEYTALPMVAVGGLLIVVGAAWGPETKDVDFSAAPRKKTGRHTKPSAESVGD
jgi:MFS family permease